MRIALLAAAAAAAAAIMTSQQPSLALRTVHGVVGDRCIVVPEHDIASVGLLRAPSVRGC